MGNPSKKRPDIISEFLRNCRDGTDRSATVPPHSVARMEALEEDDIDVQWVDGKWIVLDDPHAVRWDCCPMAAQMFETSDILHRIIQRLSAPTSLLLLAAASRTLHKALSPSNEELWKHYYQREFDHPAAAPLMPHGVYNWCERYKQARLLLLSPQTACWKTFPVGVHRQYAPEPGGPLWPLGRRGARGVVSCGSASLISTGGCWIAVC